MADRKPKDLDFEELHEAVNALMDQAQRGEKPKTPKASKAEPPAEVQPQDDSIKVSVKRPAPVLAGHTGSHGRAMDVVARQHQKPEVIMPPSAQTKRLASTLQPTQDVKPEPATPVIVPERPPLPNNEHDNDLNDALASLDMHGAPSPAPEQTMTHHKNDWPDPLDALDKSIDEDQEAEAAQAEPKIETEPDATKQEEPAPTLESDDKPQPDEPEKPERKTPFLATKVEKRPLGAYSDSLGDDANDSLAAPTPQAAQAEQKETPNPLPAQQQPEEFNPAIVAVESTEAELTPKQDDESDKQDLRAMSIPQQYPDSAKSTDDSTRPVFDTKEYHPAIEAHSGSHHGSSAGAWIMAIVLLVLLVAVLGAAYYFITGDLDFSALLGQ